MQGNSLQSTNQGAPSTELAFDRSDLEEMNTLADPWFETTEPVLLATDPVIVETLEFQHPNLRPNPGWGLLLVLFVVLVPLFYAAMAMI
jgi:hypothetical protein